MQAQAAAPGLDTMAVATPDDYARYLIETVGVAVVPASSFYRAGEAEAKRRVRFCYPKRDETLLAAGERLATLSRR